jgi:hypothetical protein
MSYKHSQIAEELLEEAGIIYNIPTAGHYVIYKAEEAADGTDKLIWYPKSNKVQTTNKFGNLDIHEKGTREDTIEYIKKWLEEV